MKKLQFNKKQFLSWLFQLILLAFVFYTASWYQQRNMLVTGEKIKQSQLSLLSITGQAKHYQLDNGKNDTFIYFFAPWCSVCHASIDNLENIYRSKPEAIEIIVIALDWSSIDEVDEFLSQHELTMPILLGTNQVMKNFKIKAFPSYYLISRNGEIVSKNMGYTTELGINWRILFNR